MIHSRISVGDMDTRRRSSTTDSTSMEVGYMPIPFRRILMQSSVRLSRSHAVAVILTRLYLDQGLLYDDLELITGGMPTQYANLSKNSSIPDVAGGILWADEVNKIFYLYGGEFSSTPQNFQLWGYDVILNQWNQSAPSNTQVERLSYGAGVAVNEKALGMIR